MSKQRIGIMGGTFDPIHNGHLILAEHSRLHFDLERVIFIPTGKPPHKNQGSISASNHRYKMTSSAIDNNPYFGISSIELEDPGITYTVDTIGKLKEKYKDAVLYFVLGSDSFFNIHKWKNYKKLIGLCQFIVVKRPLPNNEALVDRVKHFNREGNGSFHILEAPLIDISSTNIRDRVRDGLSIRYMVPEAVEHYIKREELYRGEE